MSKIEALIVNSLYRATCPDSMELGEYQMGLLAPERAEAVRNHLRECRLCSGEAKMMDSFHKSLAPELEIKPSERIKAWVARLMPGFSGSGLSPALNVRGDVGQVMAYQAGESQLSLTIDEDPDNPERRTLTGLLIGAPQESVHVNLLHGERMSTLGLIDDLGNFTIVGIKPGQYELALRGKTFEIFVSPLRID